MKINEIDLGSLRFPGRAGELQAAGATAALIRELGDNYATYHDFLAKRLARFGGRPKAEDFEDVQDYYDAWAEIESIVATEAFLRGVHRMRKLGQPLRVTLGGEDTPLVDADTETLVSIL